MRACHPWLTHLQGPFLGVPLLVGVEDAQVSWPDGGHVLKAADIAGCPRLLYAALEREQVERVHRPGPAVSHQGLVAVDCVRQNTASLWDAGLQHISETCHELLMPSKVVLQGVASVCCRTICPVGCGHTVNVQIISVGHTRQSCTHHEHEHDHGAQGIVVCSATLRPHPQLVRQLLEERPGVLAGQT